ncbi:MAG TPA: hypothetical protein VGT07_13760 [Steroidobacteraceae bacterium]|nr:hypothetical protein [Steroidobacteraceae bacterium]
MTTKTCAACDSPLDGNAIKVKLGQNTVEVCCDECARALGEADAAKAAKKQDTSARKG